MTTMSTGDRGVALPAPFAWEALPAAQQPQWRQHPAYERTRDTLLAAAPLVTLDEVAELRAALALVAAGEARLLQTGDCAESFYECTPWHTSAKVEVLDRLGDRVSAETRAPVVRVGRIGGQFAKPRSQPVERLGDVDLPVFRGHLVNSEVATRAARQPDPRRMVWAYEASAKVMAWVREHRDHRERNGVPRAGAGPWTSHEALVVDYETALVRSAADGTPYLASTHLPWIGERTRQVDAAHLRLAAYVTNPVGCKIGPTGSIDDVLEICATLDPDRTPGRLVLITRMGRDAVLDALPDVVRAVQRAGHPVVWLCDPMHGNTVKSSSGLKTRHVADVVAEARGFRDVLEHLGAHVGGLHLEVAAADVTECVGGGVRDDETLATRYTTLCDPRLNPDQAMEVVETLF